VREAIDEYLKLDRGRRRNLHSDGPEQFVRRWGDFSGVGKLSPHDLRRTAITRALDQGLSYRQVQMMSGHKDPKTVMRYDHNRENVELNAINFLQYEDEPKERKSG